MKTSAISLFRSAFLAGAASLVCVSAFGTATASDRFSTQADSRQVKSEQQIFNTTGGSAPKSVQATGGGSFSAGVTSTADEAQTAANAASIKAEQVRREAEAAIASNTRTISREAGRLDRRIDTEAKQGCWYNPHTHWKDAHKNPEWYPNDSIHCR